MPEYPEYKNCTSVGRLRVLWQRQVLPKSLSYTCGWNAFSSCKCSCENLVIISPKSFQPNFLKVLFLTRCWWWLSTAARVPLALLTVLQPMSPQKYLWVTHHLPIITWHSPRWCFIFVSAVLVQAAERGSASDGTQDFIHQRCNSHIDLS